MDKKEALKKIKAGGFYYDHAVDMLSNYEELKADKEVVLAAVKQAGRALEYADKKLQADKEVVLAALKQDGRALQYADKKLKADKNFVLVAVKQNGDALEYADKKLKADKNFVLVALKQDGEALEYADKKLQADKDVVLVAVKKSYAQVVKEYGTALEYADKKFKADKEVVLIAVKKNGRALEYADKKLKADKKIVLVAVKSYGRALEYADKKLQADKKIVLAAVKQAGWALQYADKKLRADKDVVLAAVKENKNAEQFALTNFKGQQKILTITIEGSSGDFSRKTLSLKEYKNKKDNFFKWMEQEYGDTALLTDSEVMLAISDVAITVEYMGETIISDQLSNMTKPKIKDGQKYWRDFSSAGKDKVGVVWFHDSAANFRYEWHDVDKWDPSKLKIDAWIIPLDDSNTYGDLGIFYDNKPPKEFDFESSPKSGYYGPYFFLPAPSKQKKKTKKK